MCPPFFVVSTHTKRGNIHACVSTSTMAENEKQGHKVSEEYADDFYEIAKRKVKFAFVKLDLLL